MVPVVEHGDEDHSCHSLCDQAVATVVQ